MMPPDPRKGDTIAAISVLVLAAVTVVLCVTSLVVTAHFIVKFW